MDLPRLGSLAWVGLNAAEAARFRRALRRPRETQQRLLSGYLRTNAETAFGRHHKFASIRSVEEFQARVPIGRYADFESWIARIRGGEHRVLTVSPVRVLQSTGGTSRAKQVPFTPELQAEMHRAVAPWIVDIARRFPRTLCGRSYWAISPVGAAAATDAGVRIGFEDDAEYLGGVWRRLVDRTMAVPSALRLVADFDAWRYLTLLFLLAAEDLALISVWHPSFLTLLLDAMPEHWDRLLDDLRAGTLRPPGSIDTRLLTLPGMRLRPQPRRAAALHDTGPHTLEAAWPRLTMVSAWGDGHAAGALDRLRRRLSPVHVQPKGLLATEACVTIPFAGATPLAVRSHFFEFVDDAGRVHLADGLTTDVMYSVVVTTAGGLCRYALEDRVRCIGFLEETPVLRFLGKAGHVSDLCGEKLREDEVGVLVRTVLAEIGIDAAFAMLAPDTSAATPGYVLYLEGEHPLPPDLAPRLERALRTIGDYDYAARLGQLVSARVFRIAPGCGYAAYLRRCIAQGQRAGDIKPIALSPWPGWSAVFETTDLTVHGHFEALHIGSAP